ncbi:unnamed protein product [Prunus armeniaca]|uniref:RNase H type-1 domain-containing protein n=1 Tax=Prunus armeniaca TaxID=36596 RepID=A0A6J5VAP8_PRUAR|nr:unnamed protein product [Prunus armeniaca]
MAVQEPISPDEPSDEKDPNTRNGRCVASSLVWEKLGWTSSLVALPCQDTASWLLATWDLIPSTQHFLFATVLWRSSLPTPEKQWQPPLPCYFKLNVDSALILASGLSGVGVVVRDSYGRICGVVAMCTPSESDSLAAIQLLLKKETCYTAKGVLVEEIRQLLASLPSFSACFVPCTTNGVVDPLALFNLVEDDLSFWFTDPTVWLQDYLIEDSPVYHPSLSRNFPKL